MAAADKLNGAYWRKRAIELAEKQKREDEDLCLRFHREYERILYELDKEISIFYARYAANESISMADARKLLRDAELEDFRMSLDEFRDKAIAGGFDKELEEVYLRSRISRLQALQTQVELRMMELFQSQRDILRDHLQDRYTDTYYRTVYAVSQQVDVASTFARIDPQTIEKILAVPWVGSEFSSRIWADKDKLTRELMQTLSRGFVRGDSLDRMTKEFAQRMSVSESRAATLIHTESAHMAAAATERGYRETGVKSYRFEAALDLKTCSVCGALDQREFPLAEHETGINYPPLHPRCRCTTVPVTEFQIGSKRAARNPATGKTEYVEKSMTYEEWRKKYVEDDATGTLADKKYKNARADQQQFEKYSAIFKTEMPRSLEAFQDMKYNDSEKWSDFQSRKQDTLNRMDFADMGDLRGTLGNKEVRQWYKYHDEHIPDLLDTSKPLEEQARQACELRNTHRTQARELMKDQKLRKQLDETDPNKSFEELLADKMQRKNLTREQAVQDILNTATKTRKSVNKALGLE